MKHLVWGVSEGQDVVCAKEGDGDCGGEDVPKM